MPQTKKQHTCSHHTNASRWHHFHFSGKVIISSVLFGFGLVLIGGLLMAIDNGGQSKPDPNMSETAVQSKVPTFYVGTVVMGIGGFAVIVGVVMCVAEIKFFRIRDADTNPLMNCSRQSSHEGASVSNNAIPTSPKQCKPSNGSGKTTSSASKTRKKKISAVKSVSIDRPKSPVPPPSQTKTNAATNFSSTSEEFLTPPNSFDANRILETTSSKQSSKKLCETGGEFRIPSPCSKSDSLSLESSTEMEKWSSLPSEVQEYPFELSLNKSSEFMSPIVSFDERSGSLKPDKINEQILLTSDTPKPSNAVNMPSFQVGKNNDPSEIEHTMQDQVQHHSYPDQICVSLIPEESKNDDLESDRNCDVIFKQPGNSGEDISSELNEPELKPNTNCNTTETHGAATPIIIDTNKAEYSSGHDLKPADHLSGQDEGATQEEVHLKNESIPRNETIKDENEATINATDPQISTPSESDIASPDSVIQTEIKPK